MRPLQEPDAHILSLLSAAVCHSTSPPIPAGDSEHDGIKTHKMLYPLLYACIAVH